MVHGRQKIPSMPKNLLPSVESEACSVFRLKQKKFGVPTHKLTNSRPHLEKAGGGRARKKARMPLFPLPFLRMCASVSKEFSQNVQLWTRFNATWYGTTLWRTHCVFGLKYAGHKIWRQNGSKKGQVTARAMGKKEARSNDASSQAEKNSSVPFSSIDWTPSIVAMLGLQYILYKFGGLECFEIFLGLTVTKEYRILTVKVKR